MIRLIKIELLKVVSYRAFWIMIIFYALILAFMIFGIPGLLDYIAEKTGEAKYLRIFKAVAFNFPDIWQNITYVASLRFFIKIILGIVVIILVTTEFHFLTVRANVISGYSRADYLLGKIEMIVLLSLFSTVVIFLSGLYLGSVHSATVSFSSVFGKMIFLLAYFIELISYLLFCMFLGFLFKKTGIAFIAHFVYLIIEPILDYRLNDAFGPFLPINAINNIIQTPNTSLIKVKTDEFNFDFQEAVSLLDVGICLGYALLFVFLSYLLLKKRDI